MALGICRSTAQSMVDQDVLMVDDRITSHAWAICGMDAEPKF